jgi:hypothetical protein
MLRHGPKTSAIPIREELYMGCVLRVPLVGIGFLHSAIDLNGKPPLHVM